VEGRPACPSGRASGRLAAARNGSIALWAAADISLGITCLIYRVSRRPRP
jgi:hypothetical protein